MKTLVPPIFPPESGCCPLTERSRRTFSFESENPYSFDLNWPEENCFGEMRGLGAFRVDATRPVRLLWTVEADTITTVRATGDSAVTLSVFAEEGATPRISVQAVAHPPAKKDPLSRAILGDHPLHWMHTLIHGVGSPAWAIFAQEARVWPPRLDRILGRWRELSTGAENALWRCAGDEAALSSLLDWAYRLEEGMPASDIDAAVRVSLAASPRWAASPEAEWLEACSGFPLSMLHASIAADRLRTASSLLIELVKMGLDAQRLESLSGMADVCLGQERLSPATVRTLHQKRLHHDALERVCRDIYAEAQASLGTAAEQGMGLVIGGSAGWPLAEATFDLAQAGAAGALQAALGNDVQALVNPVSGVRAAPGLLTLGAARPIRLKVSLPPLPYRRASGVIAKLSQAEACPVSGSRIEISLPVKGPVRLPIGEESLVRRMTLAAVRSAAREPGAAVEEFGCEDSFPVCSGIPAVLWRRVLDRYGLPSPAAEGTACLRLWVPDAWTEIWPELPHSRDETFRRVFSSVAEAIQAAARRWLPHLALKEASRYNEPATTLPLLAYAASQPYRSSNKRAFTHERNTASGFQLAFDSAEQEFPGIIREVHRVLHASSHRSTRSYCPVRTQTLFGTVFRQRRYFTNLLAVDALLVEEVLHLADSAAELHSLADSPRFAAKLLFKAIDSAQSGLCRRLRRLYDGRSFDGLLSVIWVEATAAACRAMGARAEVSAALTLQHGGRCEHFHNAAALGRC